MRVPKNRLVLIAGLVWCVAGAIVCTVGLSISILVYIIVFQYVFAYKFGWFPVQGWSDSVATNLITYAPLPVLLAVMT